MSAHIQSIFICPRCQNGITSIETTTSCPSCLLPLGKQTIAPYTPPYTLTEQHEKYQDTEQHVKTFNDLPIEKANSIMNDALYLIQTIPGKNTPTTDIRDVIGMAIRIGNIAKAYDAFLTAGGKHVPSLFIKPPALPPTSALGDSYVQPETPGGGEQTPSSTADTASAHVGSLFGSGDSDQ